MSLAAPLWLLAGGLAVVVLIFHALRHQQVEVPSIILWRRLAAGSRSRSMLHVPRWNLLLLLQLLAVLLLAAALAQPIIGPNRQPLHEIFVLDTSGSMRATDAATSRIDEAREALRSRLDTIEDGARVSILEADGAILFARQPKPAALIPEIDRLEAGDGTADWSRVASRLAAIVRDAEDTRLTVLTDAGEPASEALRRAHPDLPLSVETFGGELVANAGVTATLTPGEGEHRWVLDGVVTVTDERELPPDVVVRFMPAAGSSFLDWVRVTPNARATSDGDVRRFGFEAELELPDDGLLTVALPEDGFPHDNLVGFVAGAEPRVRALYIGPGNRTLELALLARGDVDLFSTATAPEDMTGYDLLIAEDVTLAERPATNVLWLGSARVEGEEQPAAADGTPIDWDSAHPLSRELRWAAISADGAVGAPLMPGAQAIVSAADAVLVQARTTGAGREVRLGLPTEPDGWARTPQFPTFVANLIDWLDAATMRTCTAGRACNVPARLIGAEVRDGGGNVVRSAVGHAGAVLDSADSFVPHRAGIYRVGDGQDAATIFVNADGRERAVAASGAGAWPDVPMSRPLPLSLWLVALAGIVLLVEAILAGRGSERFLHPAAMASGTPGSRPRRWTLGFRVASLALVCLALLNAPLPTPGPAEDTILIMDLDAAGDASRPPLLAGVLENGCDPLSMQSLGLVALGGKPQVARDTCPGQAAEQDASRSPGEMLHEALELAAAMVQPERAARIVVASDGSGVLAEAGRVAAHLAERGLTVDAMPLADWQPGDNLVAALELPERIVDGDRPLLETLIQSASGDAGPARVVVAADGEVIERLDITLVPGANRISSQLPALAEGDHEVAVSLEADDPEPANNSIAASVSVQPAPLVAIVTPQEQWGQYFADALAMQGIRSEVLRPNRAPFFMDEWLQYSAVALLNVPAIDLNSKQQEQLEEFVRVHGRGLLILGGENSFGPGGYFQTPLEAVSPLSARIPKDMPVAALGFVLDRSGSMQATVEGVTRLDIAKEATLSAVELLNDESQVSVVVFDTVPTKLVPMQDRKDLPAIETALQRLEPGGGTSIYPGLEMMIEEMAAAESPIRHIVVMSDGLTQPGNFEALVARARAMDITVSAVAIGSGADVRTLQEIARSGGGAFHATSDFRALPSILSQEAMMLNDEAMERAVRPVAWLDAEQPFLEGLPDPMPPIESYVLTTAKPQAILHLATEDDAGDLVPILASWRYGNGSVMALATHGAGPGSVRWLELPEYPLLWAQAVRQFLPTTPGPGISLGVTRSGDRLVVAADVLDENAEPLVGAMPEATATLDGNEAVPIAFAAVAPGRYEAAFDAPSPGKYWIEVSVGEGLSARVSHIVSYPSGLAFHRASPARLEALAATTGGRILSAGENITSASIRWTVENVWRPWVLLALATLLTDLALRYVPGLFPFLRERATKRAPRQLEVPA